MERELKSQCLPKPQITAFSVLSGFEQCTGKPIKLVGSLGSYVFWISTAYVKFHWANAQWNFVPVIEIIFGLEYEHRPKQKGRTWLPLFSTRPDGTVLKRVLSLHHHDKVSVMRRKNKTKTNQQKKIRGCHRVRQTPLGQHVHRNRAPQVSYLIGVRNPPTSLDEPKTPALGTSFIANVITK